MIVDPLWMDTTIFVIVMDSSFIEQVEEPAIYISLYRFLWSFDIPYKVGQSYSSLLGVFIDYINGLWFAKLSATTEETMDNERSVLKFQPKM